MLDRPVKWLLTYGQQFICRTCMEEHAVELVGGGIFADGSVYANDPALSIVEPPRCDTCGEAVLDQSELVDDARELEATDYAMRRWHDRTHRG